MMQAMTSAATLRMIDEFWAERLGCTPGELYAQTVIVREHHGSLAGYHGVYAYRRDGGACIVSAPADYVARLRGALAALTPERAFDVEALAGALGDEVERVVGPARIAYADSGDFRRADDDAVRLLVAGDDAALRGLAASCGETAWEHGGIEFGRAPVFGAFERGGLLAAASYTPWGDHILHAGVVAHPVHRGRGLGRAVASAASAHGLASGRVMQWQTLESNTPSMAIGRALGYQPYCRTIAVRLR